MKKILFILIGCLVSVYGWPQLITSNPQFITQSGGVIELIYDAASTEGNLGLKDYTGDVYAHIGVITSASTSNSDWKYVLTPWPNATNQALANTSKNKLTPLGNNKFKLTLAPTVRDFLGVPSTETIKKIALVFRNADGSKQGKTASGGDIFVDVYPAGLNVAFANPAQSTSVTAGTALNIELGSSLAASLNLTINGTSVQTASGSTSLKYSYTFATANDYTLIGQATLNGITVADTVQVCVPAPVTNEARPTGLKDGITYTGTTSATLSLYAPGKSNVFLIGDFNNWTQLNAYQLKKDGNYWWITVTGLTPGRLYGFQYLVDGVIKISDPYTELVLDPWNDQWINQYSIIYPNLKPYPAGKTEGLVATLQTAKPAYNWEVTSFNLPSAENVVIYELLLRDFTPEKSLDGAMARLDYLKNLGVTAVELMPIQEFDGNNSWGYNPNHYFAPDKAYGSPEKYKKFIDECHKRGMAVILDMVFNHATGVSPFAMLYWDATNNRPATNNPWMNPVAPHMYSVYNDFNHSFSGTKEYFKRVLQYWVTEYKVDGYRMDLSKGFTQNSGTESTYDQSRIDNCTDYFNAVKSVKASAMFILEHFAASSEELALANKGIYLWRNLNNAYSQAAMGFQASSDFSGMVTTPRQWVGYAESHDEERNFYKAKAFGNGNLKTDSIARVQRVPLNIAFTVLLPGPKMIWEFGEMGYDYSIDSNGGRLSEKPSAWGYLNLPHRKAAADASAKIITLRKLYPAAFTQGSYQLNVSSADWPVRRVGLVHADLNMVVLGNFDASTPANATPAFGKTGTWFNLLTGEELQVTNTGMTMTLQPGQLLVLTDRKVNLPADVTNPQAGSDCLVFPSVTNGPVYITSDTGVKGIKVYNAQGLLVRKFGNANEIGIGDLPNGMYFITVQTSSRESVFKILKE